MSEEKKKQISWAVIIISFTMDVSRTYFELRDAYCKITRDDLQCSEENLQKMKASLICLTILNIFSMFSLGKLFSLNLF